MPKRPGTLRTPRPDTPVLAYPAASQGNRQKRRLLPTNSSAWIAIRAQVLTREPLCRICASKGITCAASHVDHIDSSNPSNARSNLQPLCASCHSRKTAAEDGGFGNRKRGT